jgi:hypothetical protein
MKSLNASMAGVMQRMAGINEYSSASNQYGEKRQWRQLSQYKAMKAI